jgi:nucleoside-diphosphate-sugar epimerase
VFIDDVVSAVEKVIDRRDVLSGEALNIASGRGIPLEFVAQKISNLLHTCPEYSVIEDRSGDVTRFTADISKAQSVLDWQPSTRLENGLNETIKWFNSQPDLAKDIRNNS